VRGARAQRRGVGVGGRSAGPSEGSDRLRLQRDGPTGFSGLRCGAEPLARRPGSHIGSDTGCAGATVSLNSSRRVASCRKEEAPTPAECAGSSNTVSGRCDTLRAWRVARIGPMGRAPARPSCTRAVGPTLWPRRRLRRSSSCTRPPTRLSFRATRSRVRTGVSRSSWSSKMASPSTSHGWNASRRPKVS
jgi:hypothetical protein